MSNLEQLHDANNGKTSLDRAKARDVILTYEKLRMIGCIYGIFPQSKIEKNYKRALDAFYARDYTNNVFRELSSSNREYEKKLEELEIEEIQLDNMKSEETDPELQFWQIKRPL